MHCLDLKRFQRYLSLYYVRGDLILNVILLTIFEIVSRFTVGHYLVLEIFQIVFRNCLRFPTHLTRCKCYFLRWTSKLLPAEREFSRKLEGYCLKSFFLLNTTKLWIKYLLVNRVILDRFSPPFWDGLNSVLSHFLQITWELSFHIFILSKLLPFWIALIYVIKSYTKRWSNYSYVWSLMFVRINLNIFVRFGRICTLFLMFLGAGCAHLPIGIKVQSLRKATYINLFFPGLNINFFTLWFVLTTRSLCLRVFFNPDEDDDYSYD